MNQRFRIRNGLSGEPVGLVLVSPGEDIQHDGKEEIEGRIEHGEEDEPGIDRGPVHVKGLAESPAVYEEREEKEGHTRLENTDDHPLDYVLQLVVADLMGENGNQFGDGMVRHKRIVEGDPLVPSKAGEEGISFR